MSEFFDQEAIETDVTDNSVIDPKANKQHKWIARVAGAVLGISAIGFWHEYTTSEPQKTPRSTVEQNAVIHTELISQIDGIYLGLVDQAAKLQFESSQGDSNISVTEGNDDNIPGIGPVGADTLITTYIPASKEYPGLKYSIDMYIPNPSNEYINRINNSKVLPTASITIAASIDTSPQPIAPGSTTVTSQTSNTAANNEILMSLKLDKNLKGEWLIESNFSTRDGNKDLNFDTSSTATHQRSVIDNLPEVEQLFGQADFIMESATNQQSIFAPSGGTTIV